MQYVLELSSLSSSLSMESSDRSARAASFLLIKEFLIFSVAYLFCNLAPCYLSVLLERSVDLTPWREEVLLVLSFLTTELAADLKLF